MDVFRSRKTTKVLYLYLTIPLLIMTAVFGMIALMTHTKHASAPKPESTAISNTPTHLDAGTEAPDKRLSVELAPPDASAVNDESDDKSDSTKESTAGNAASVTAIMGGLTGLMGAITQTVMAFLTMRDRRRSQSGDEESEWNPSR